MKKIKACIFDLDGVIVDTAVYHFRAWKRLADELGIPFTEQDNEKLKGVSRTRSLELILELGGQIRSEADKLALASRKNEWYTEMISGMTPREVLPGAVHFLESCKGADLKTALGSASRNAGIILERTGLSTFFDAIVDGNKVSTAKPDPEVFLKAAAELNVQAADCCVFEDAIAGVEAAVAAGMHIVGIGSPELLRAADLVIRGLDEMDLDKLTRIGKEAADA